MQLGKGILQFSFAWIITKLNLFPFYGSLRSGEREMSCGAEYGDIEVVEWHFVFSQKFMHKVEWGEVLQW